MLASTTSPAFAWQPPQGSPLPSPNDCVPVYAGAVAAAGTLATYQSSAGLACGRPGNTAPYGAGAAFTTAAAVPDGAVCQQVFYAPVRFQNLPASIHATWVSPGGGSGAASIDPESDGAVVTAAGQPAATNDVFAMYAQSGTFQGGQCQAEGGWQDFCQLGAPGPNPDPCILTQPHVITPAQSPPPGAGPYVARVVSDLRARAGQIGSLPSPAGLVNLPTCFWVDGIAVPDERDYTMVLAGPPDGSNRRIYYTYLIRVFFAGIDWNFDDPYGDGQVQPNPACGQHAQMTAHAYAMISQKRAADGTYHVSATERYQVTVDLYWDDSYGPHHRAMDPGVPLPITVSPPAPYRQFVGQVEGIPMAG